MCKTKAIAEEILTKYDPTFQNPVMLKQLKNDPKYFNVEYLVEKTMALVGGYNFVNGHHHDFSDGTECKTASVQANPRENCPNSYPLEISNIVSPGGTMKTGDIRLVLYNPHIKEGPKCTFYYIPNEDLVGLGIDYHPKSKMGRIRASWNIRFNRIVKLDSYKVDSFLELAKTG